MGKNLPNSFDNFMRTKVGEKKALCENLRLNEKKPLLGVLVDHELSEEEMKKLKEILKAVKAWGNAEIAILADTNLEALKKMAAVIPYGRKNRMSLLKASDFALAFSFSDIDEFLLNGVVPVAGMRKETKDYDPNRETGNSFVYSNDNPWAIFAAIVRATETYKFPYDWKNIVREGIRSTEN